MMSAVLYQYLPGTLPRNIIQNAKIDGNYLTITTLNGKDTIGPHMPVVYDMTNDSMSIEDEIKNW